MEVQSLNTKPFEARDVMNLFSIDKNKLFYWIKTHRLLKPDIAQASGTGSRVRFSIKNLLEIAVIKELLKFGFDLNTVKQIKGKIDRYESQDKNIYLEIVKDEHKKLRNVFIYKIGKKFDIYIQGRMAEIQVPGEPGPRPAFDANEWKGGNPPSNLALRLQLGKVAADMLDELEKKNY